MINCGDFIFLRGVGEKVDRGLKLILMAPKYMFNQIMFLGF